MMNKRNDYHSLKSVSSRYPKFVSFRKYNEEKKLPSDKNHSDSKSNYKRYHPKSMEMESRKSNMRKNNSSQESFFNRSQKENKQEENHSEFKKYWGNKGESNTRSSPNIISLSKGTIFIQRNEIETDVQCNISHLNTKGDDRITMICPSQHVRIEITPLALNKSQVFDSKTRSFI
mmetsp:Transcript_20388/g.18055  ORF Transcript_20388/g.18055 Transcript_20388/m.18055 type:complete len:175 (-) Transcript_20388:382-906(-)